MKELFFLFLVAAVLSAGICSATKIHGTVYDTSLNSVEDSVVEVNSVPLQRMISKDGSYSFNLNPGDYVITARYDGMLARESVSIKDESGDYVLDLFLFPTFEEEEDLFNTTGIEINNPYFRGRGYSLLIIAVVVVAAFSVALFVYKKRAKPGNQNKTAEKQNETGVADELDDVVAFIKSEGGRVTQKDIRKKFPLSEAKISLVISELEHRGIVEKIKKGRGNVIVLKK